MLLADDGNAEKSLGRHGATRVVLLVAMLLPSCGAKSLPTGPSDQGVTIYPDANYIGKSARLTESIADLSDFKGECAHEDSNQYSPTLIYNWEDCISSIRIAPGWRATLYRNRDYRGDSLEVTGDVPNLQLVPGGCDHDGLNDCISSIKLFAP